MRTNFGHHPVDFGLRERDVKGSRNGRGHLGRREKTVVEGEQAARTLEILSTSLQLSLRFSLKLAHASLLVPVTMFSRQVDFFVS